MKRATVLRTQASRPQTADDRSFIGGVPLLPATQPLPSCSHCGATQTFYFQLEFPPSHVWAGHGLAMFFCTRCADEERTMPAQADPARGARIGRELLER